ncbi:MAG: hypothetical protein QOE30_1366 [Mycobacterium sp.]|nr:hypothetical protein [Mycobacterium sp.]
MIPAARVLAEFGDDATRFADAKARKNYADTSPITRASGTRKIVLARVFSRSMGGGATVRVVVWVDAAVLVMASLLCIGYYLAR